MLLAEARCRCVYGIDIGLNSACKEVYYNVQVLRRTNNCVNGRYEFEPGWQRISVGCTMAMASS